MSDKYPEMKQDATLCFCNSNKAWGGGERWHLESALYFAREGYNVILACGRGDPLWRMAEEELAADTALAGSALPGDSGRVAHSGPAVNSERPRLAERFRLADWSFGNLSFLNPFKGSAFSRFLAVNRVSHLILNLPADLKVGVPAAGRKNSFQGAVKVYYRRGSAIPVKASGMNGYLYSRLTALVANSKETAECVRQAHIMDPARIQVIYNGLDASAFDAKLRAAGIEVCGAPGGDNGPVVTVTECGEKREQEECREGEGSASVNWPQPPLAQGCERLSRPLVIGNAGRLSTQKAQKYLLHMSAELKRRNFPHKLVIAGDGELRDDLLKLASSLELQPCSDRSLFAAERISEDDLRAFREQEGEVCFAGFLKNMAPFWAVTDLFALSSIWEGFGYVLAEAMLAEKPLLAFDCNSMPELVRDGLNGALLAAPATGEDDAAVGARLADKIIELASGGAEPDNQDHQEEPGCPDRRLDGGGPNENDKHCSRNCRDIHARRNGLTYLHALGRAGRAFCLENFDQKVSMSRLEDLLFGGLDTPVISFETGLK